MTITKVLTPVAFVALLSMAAAPARADQRRGGGHYRGVERGRVVVRGGGGFIRARSPFYRPYYSFRPRVSLGFGLWMGSPVPYPYYGSPYRYAPPYVDPYAYGAPAPYYPPSNYPSSNYPAQQPAPSVGVQRGGAQSEGGISFEITPANAAVFVDGTYVGTAEEFGPAEQPLDLAPGHHRVELSAPGYRTTTSDADVQPRQVIPFQGTLQRN
jgi:hypothetical protein